MRCRADIALFVFTSGRFVADRSGAVVSYVADRSSKMDFSEYNRIDDFDLDEIVWQTIKGKGAETLRAIRPAIASRGIGLPTDSENIER
jgi:hypothetical protein